ncbi:hypothetical protein [Herbaspirillum seropedicae]|uniref:hypothetical protein n=1 Tax=Herbaspirillum seropedicae TaxID=964 RepID=UPI003FCCEF7F
MNTNNDTAPAQDAAVAVSSLPKRCPVEGEILVKMYLPIWECDCWVCPACEYTEPIL